MIQTGTYGSVSYGGFPFGGATDRAPSIVGTTVASGRIAVIQADDRTVEISNSSRTVIIPLEDNVSS